MSDAPEISITNYAPSGREIALRPVAFGVGGAATILIEIGYDPDSVSITMGNGPEHGEIPEFLRDVAEVLTTIADGSDIVERIDEAQAGRS